MKRQTARKVNHENFRLAGQPLYAYNVQEKILRDESDGLLNILRYKKRLSTSYDMNCWAVFCPDRRMEPLFIREPRPKTAFNQAQKKRNSVNLK